MAVSTILLFSLRVLVPIYFAISSVEASLEEEDHGCRAYIVSGPDLGYFQHYHFSDFRAIPSVEDNDFTTAPPLVTSLQENGGSPLTSSFFNQSTWQEYWSVHDGVRKPDSLIPPVYLAQNVFVARNSTPAAETDTYLTLRASRPGAFVSAAEIELNIDQILYASLRARLRVLPNGLSNLSAPTAGPAEFLTDPDTDSNQSHPVDSGAVLGFFFYHNDTQETDIEILTQDQTNRVRYTNQPDYDASDREDIVSASSELVMPHGHVVTEWLDYRIDWFDGVSRWYINGDLVLNKTINVPSAPSTVFMNLWSNGESWSGNMSVGAQVYVGVQWVEIAYNTSQNGGSDDRGEESCYVDSDDSNQSTVATETTSTGATSTSTTSNSATSTSATSTSAASSSGLYKVDNAYRITILPVLMGIWLCIT